MPQSSLEAWLKKPSAVKKPLTSVHQHTCTIEPPQIPTPPLEGDHDIRPDCHAPHVPGRAIFGQVQRPLPPNVDLRSCTKEDIPHLKRLTSLLLPIQYPEKFYKEIIEDSLTNSITLLAVWHDNPSKKGLEKGNLVGAISCRLLAQPSPSAGQPNKGDLPMLYLNTLALLSPYRSFGIATHMLHLLTKCAINNYGISSIGAHVWEANTEGLEWYEKRGFREVARETGYYRRLDPQTAVVVKRDVSVTDLMGG